MNKLVVLKLDGSFNQGFRVSLEIGLDGERPHFELSDNLLLPPIPILPEIYQDWCKSYRSLDGYRIKAKKQQISNVRFQSLTQECHQKAEIIKQQFLNWLQTESFQLIKQQCLTQLNSIDAVRFIIRTREMQLRKLPWHLWDLFAYYPHAEVALSSLDSQRLPRKYRPQVRILIILGNSEGINVAEDEKLLKKYCQQAEIVVLNEPSFTQLNEHLWDELGWDILFFSGHSRTESTQGRIFLNGNDSLTMADLREGLKTAVRRGLQLAFFNSCDGLGIAAELESLHIPQVIVMREPVPDRVAHQFLKYFFQEFTGGKSLYESVNIARKKLQGLEKDCPCASWLPVIVQNLLEIPPTWQSLGAIANCPYRGLAAFTSEDAAYFYGREMVTQQLVTAVKNQHFVAVVGASGSGKSSLVFAGLIPQLRQDKTKDWLIVSFRPGNNPFESLAIALVSVFHGVDGTSPPSPLLNKAHAYTQVVKFSQVLTQTPPNPQFWGNKSFQSPPELGDLGGSIDSNEDRQDLCVHCNLNKERGGFSRGEIENQQRLSELEVEVELKNSESALQNFIESIAASNPLCHVVIIADQFEEIYTLFDDSEERKVFIDNLLNAVNYVPNFTLIINLRADFYGEALSYRPLADALQDAQLNLTPMNASELQAAIEQPAQNLNVQLEAGLTPRLLDVVLESPSHLPLLQFTLTQLWQQQHQGWLTHQAYADIGGVETALANHAETTYAQLSPQDKERVQQICIQLVQPGESNQDIRRIATREEIGEDNWQLVARLADARLVVTNRNPVTGVETGEIVHEALIKHWRRLGQWMRMDRDFRLWQERLKITIAQWENSHKDDGALLRGKPLSDAEDWLLQRSQQVSYRERTFIDLSVEFRDREAQARNAARRRVLLGLTGGLVVASLLASLAFWQWQKAEYQRQQAQVNELKSRSFSARVLIQSGDEIAASIPLLRNIQTLKQLKNLDRVTHIGLLSSVLENIQQIREYNRLQGHEGTVTSVSHSPNGQLLASASQDTTVKIWGRDGKLLQSLSGHKDGVFTVAFSGNNQFLIAASFDNTVTVWKYDSSTGLFATRPVLKLSSPGILSAVAFSPDSRIIGTANQKGEVKLWTITGKLIKTIDAHNQKIWSLSFNPNGESFATASEDKTIKIWDLEGKFLKTLPGHNHGVLSVKFSPDGKTLASASKDKTVRLWSIQPPSGEVKSQKSKVKSRLLHIFDSHGNEVLDVRFSADGKFLASASADDTVKVWTVPQFPVTSPQSPLYTFKGHGGKASEVSFSPDGKSIATTTADKTVKLWRLQGILPSFAGNSVSVSPDGATFALGNQQGSVTLRQRDGKVLHSFSAHTGEIIKVLFHPTGKSFVTIGGDNQIKLWNLSGKLLKSWQGYEKGNQPVFNGIQDISFSPDGKTLATIGGIDAPVKIWNLAGDLLTSWETEDKFLTAIDFSPDGKSLATAGGKRVKLWDMQGKLLQSISGHEDNISSVKFSPDGKFIVTGSFDKTVKIWHRHTGRLLRSLTHNNGVYSLSFSSDNKILISGSGDRIYVWGVDGNLLHSLQSDTGNFLELSFSQNGNLISLVQENNVMIWNLNIDDLHQRSCNWVQDYLRSNNFDNNSDIGC